MSDRAVAAVLAGLVLVARLPFAARTLWAWDSVLYARALEEGFHVGADLTDQRPHAPGYAFYVAVAAAVRLVTRDTNAALVVVSVLASALTVAAVYLVCRRYTERALAVAFALGAASAPLAWTYGEIAMPYALLGLLSIGLAVWLRDARVRAWPAPLMASAAIGVAAGFRQDVLLLLGPLWIWMLVRRSWRERALCAAALGIAACAWLIPTASLSGGLVAYLGNLSGVGRAGELHRVGTGDVLMRNTLLTMYALWWGLIGFSLLLVTAMVARLLWRGRVSNEVGFFALWLAPPMLVYVTIHIGDPGYVMSVLPAMYVGCAALLAPLAVKARRVVLAMVALLIAVNVSVFVVADTPFSSRAIARHDRSLETAVALVRGRFPPDSTVIITQSGYLTARYYLPEYRVLFYGAEPEVLSRAVREVPITAPTTIVVFGELAASLPAGLRLSNDGGIRWGRLGAADLLVAYDLEPRVRP